MSSSVIQEYAKAAANFLNEVPQTLRDFILFLHSDAFIKAIIFPGLLFILTFVMFTIWFERKLLARVMVRLGPLHVGKYAGLLQLVADAVKLLSKELIVPEKAIKPLYVSMPVLCGALSMLAFAFLPVGPGWVIYPSDISLLLVFVVLAVTPITILVAGWASRSKYSFVGMVRFAFQVFSYEVPFFLAIASVTLAARSFNLEKIVEAQAGLPFIIPALLGFIVFLITAIAEVERVPFDLPTAEQELVSGWQTEYTGAYFALFYLAAYIKLDAVAILTALLFLGGWHGPSIPGIPESILGPFWLILKSLIVVFLVLLLRGVFPRITLDKLLDLGWRVLIPLALLNILIVAVLIQIGLL
ncbi:MAG: NADH-quinone oxidoreductase subunit NuoH [Nitrososphaerota archaeon]|nr:NADH-quinone oxidoreductase subunit NuoH [Aigarchaeota archaeon]MDW8076090.1 NADH-quinone oxidoreductase subunit NuoH [Nitrososphaerota archaeon]